MWDHTRMGAGFFLTHRDGGAFWDHNLGNPGVSKASRRACPRIVVPEPPPPLPVPVCISVMHGQKFLIT